MSIHPGALMASQAANCAAAADKYFEMRALLFAGTEQRAWGAGSLDDIDVFVGYAEQLGLNGADFESCVTSNRYLDLVRSDIAMADQLGARSTPAFIVNGRLMLGAQPIDEFRRIFDVLISPP
jgi:protein-disulfide isomerase